MMRTGHVAAVIVMLAAAACAAARPAGGEKRPDSAYRRLDPRKLSEVLSSLEMVELQEAFVKERMAAEGGKGSRALVALLVDAKIGLAGKADEAERDRLIDEAVALLKPVIAKLGKPADPDQVMERFRFQLKLADLTGRIQVQPYVDRLIYLMAAEQDRGIIIAKTKDTAMTLRRLGRSVEDTIEDWRADNVKWILYGGELLRFQMELKYQGATIDLNRAMALHDEIEAERGERGTLLNRAIASLEQFAEKREGPWPWAVLAMGRAERELKQHDRAVRAFSRLLAARTPARVRYDALFEIARSRVEQGGGDLAPREIEAFRTRAKKLAPERKVGVDLHAAMLLHYLHETRAKREKDPAAAGRHRIDAERVLLAFANSYPEPVYQNRFLSIMARKYRDRKDIRNLGSMVLFARARGKMVEGQRGPSGEGNMAALAEAMTFLEAILDRIPGPADKPPTGAPATRPAATRPATTRPAATVPAAASRPGRPGAPGLPRDEIAKELHPLVLWDLGVIRNWMRDDRACARTLLELARKYPDHKLAFRGAMAAVKSYHGIIQRDLDRNRPVHTRLRRELVEALVVLLDRWGRAAEAREWYIDLGRQYRLLARPGVAPSDEERFKLLGMSIAAFQKVPAKSMDTMEAQYLALKGRAELLRETAKPQAANARAATQLSKDMAAYAAAVPGAIKKASAALDGAADEDLRKSLTEIARLLPDWGSEAAFEAIVLRDEFLGRREWALKALEKLARDKAWKGTDVLPRAKEYEVRILVAEGRIDQAVRKVEEFLDEYPKEGEAVLGLVVKRIRGRIGKLRDDPARADELQRNRTTYLKFAEKLKKIAIERKYVGDRLYVTDQTLADALTEGGRFGQALELWKSCEARDEKRRQAQAKPIRKEIEARLAAVAKAAAGSKALEGLVNSYFELLDEKGIDPNASAAADAVRRARDALRDQEIEHKPAVQQERARRLARRLSEALAALRERLLSRLPIDVKNVHGLARSCAGLKQHAQAIEYYKQLVRGVNANDDPQLYWTLELEYCRAALAGYAGRPGSMKRLKVYMLQLQQTDTGMGGKRKQFSEIMRKVSRLAG